MSFSETVKARGGLLIVFGLGVGLFALHIRHALGAGENIQTFVFGIVIPMGFAVGMLGGGLWLWRRKRDGDYLLRVSAWCLVGALVLTGGAIFMILYEQAEGVKISDPLFLAVNAASIGGVVGLIVGVYDNRQRRARRKADRLNRRLTVLNRVLRHDIRTNADIIRSNAELLTETGTNIAKRAHKIRQQAGDLVELGEHARDIETVLHEGDAEREVVDVSSLIEAHCERIQREYPEAEIDVSLPETQLIIAHPLVTSALTNVIENAIEHNDSQPPQVTIESEEVYHDGTGHVELRIADNGPGIPESELGVLERGYETPLEHTSGLGLWLVQWIVTKSGGEVWFEENDPSGSVVFLRFERAETSATPAEPTRGVAVAQSS